MKNGKKIFKTATAATAVAVIICAAVIAISGLGMVEGYDFGVGAYYYADIPGFEKLINDEAYHTDIPLWVHIVLFLAWGWFIYRLWIWIDKRR